LDESSLSTLEDILALLSLRESKSLVSDLKMGKNVSNKSDIIKILKNNCKKQTTLFGHKGSMELLFFLPSNHCARIFHILIDII